jgi:hypothetical protein
MVDWARGDDAAGSALPIRCVLCGKLEEGSALKYQHGVICGDCLMKRVMMRLTGFQKTIIGVDIMRALARGRATKQEKLR